MRAAPVDLVLERGAKFDVEFAWTDDAGVAHDVDGYTARMQVREDIGDDGDPILDLTSAAEITVDGPAGSFLVEIPATDTADVAIDTGYYDLEILPGGVEADAIRLAEGRVFVSPNVTRPVVP